MRLSDDKFQLLLEAIGSTEPDSMYCDVCFGRIGEYAEAQLEGKPLSEGMQAVLAHLQNCPCCRDEYET